MESVCRLRPHLDRDPTPGDIAVDTKLTTDEITTMRLVSKVVKLEDVANRRLPEVLAHFHVDSGRLGGEEKKRTYHFDRHHWANAAQMLIDQPRRLAAAG
jgi:hypothetical protein